jgi:hypothetical protein
MANKTNIVGILEKALRREDPSELATISNKKYDELINLRKEIEHIIIDPDHYDLLFKWMWHSDPAIKQAVRTIVLFIDDLKFRIYLYAKLVQMQQGDVPFNIEYDVVESEFSIGLTGVPGWGISQYSGKDPLNNQLLKYLEKLYGRTHNGNIPKYFRS